MRKWLLAVTALCWIGVIALNVQEIWYRAQIWWYEAQIAKSRERAIADLAKFKAFDACNETQSARACIHHLKGIGE